MSGSLLAPRYSFIVAAYNVAREIDACIGSLTRPDMTDCEVIVVNDGSTDETRERISAFENNSRVRVIDKSNGGLSDARNAGIEAARGQYLMFVDGDDWVATGLTEYFDKTLAKHPDADLMVFGINEVTREGIKTSLWHADFWKMTNSACNKIFHRRLFEGVRFDRGFYYEDLALIPSLFLRAQHPVTIDAALYNYRRDRINSITRSVDTGVLYQLARSARRCIYRIEADAASGRSKCDLTERLGRDWLSRFETTQIFIPGILHRARQIEDRSARMAYIQGMLDRLPSRKRVQISRIFRRYGMKMAAGSLLYRYGGVRAGHFLLHDIGDLKRRITSIAARGRAHLD